MFPFLSIMPARSLTPIIVPMVSNISINKNVNTQITISRLNMLLHSNLQKMGARLGGALMIDDERLVMPIGMPMMVTSKMPISKAPVTLRTSSTALITMPMQARSTAGS